MYVFLLEFKEVMFGLLDFVKQCFNKLFKFICCVMFSLFITIRFFLFKLLCLIMVLTSIGFIGGIILLIKNITDCRTFNISFVDTKYFTTMFLLIGIHIGVMIACMIVKPKDYQ